MTAEDKHIWTENINKLKAYYKKYKNFNVPFYWKEDRLFSQWVENIRAHPKQIPKELLKQLEKINFNFKVVSDWDSMFAKLEAFYEKHGTSYVPPLQYEKLFDWTINQRVGRSLLTKEQIKKLNNVDFDWEVVSDKDIKWQNHYQNLVEFKNKYGHVKVPQYFKENKGLGDWVSKQRSKKTSGELSAARFKKLKELGFLWKEDIEKMRHGAWENKYNELLEYKKKHGHIDRVKVSRTNYHLGVWMNTQIVWKDKILPDRKKKLDALSFRWETGDIHEEKWADMYENLKAYKAKHGHCRVNLKQDFKLSVWLQRNKRDKLKIGKEKRDKLERLGVKWAYEQFKETWESRYNELKAFKKEHGHLKVSRLTKSQLFEWMETQKKFKEAKTLKPERLEKLNKIGFVWTGEAGKQKMATWETYYKKFKALKEKFGSAYHIKLKENPELDEWVRLQIHSKDKLTALKKKKLEAINFLWEIQGHYWQEQWEVMYRKLIAYKKKYGNCNVPQSYSKDRPLAQWVNGQRTKAITADRRAKLNKIGFSWAHELIEKRWLRRLKEFTDFKKKKKQIPLYTPLYSWTYQQRKNFKKLSKDKQKMLLKAGFVTKPLERY